MHGYEDRAPAKGARARRLRVSGLLLRDKRIPSCRGRASVMMTPVVPRGRYIGNPPESQSEHFIRDRWLECSARVQME
jgi:hypothetical protein